jgi:hypothetical protein
MSVLDLQLPVNDCHHSVSIPNSHVARSSRGLPFSSLSDHYDVLDPVSPTFPSSSFLSYMPASTRLSLVSVFQEPRILNNFLRYVRWHDFRSLALTCIACRNVLQHPNLRNVVLSAFVPGYQYCLRYADLDPSADIDIQLNDLNDFGECDRSRVHDIPDDDTPSVISQRLPLHLYPTHALAALSSRVMTPVLKGRTKRYIALCQAHSRIILLLQALMHSAPSPVPEELEDPSLRYRSTSQGGRELVFPAPLSFTSNDAERKENSVQQPTRKRTRLFSSSPTSARSRRTSDGQPPKRSLSLVSRLRKNKVPPPPPSADPFGLKIYSGTWRGRRRSPAVSGSASEDDGTTSRRPNRNLTSTTDSSVSSTHNSRGSPSPHPSRIAESVPMPLMPHAPHDIGSATSRLRAPILRVYFPCSELDHHTIAACEEQLEDAGLWHHLSVGDVVCNFGYLPPTDRLGSSSSNQVSAGNYRQESWMIFDGSALVPYNPSTEEVLPLSEPLSLPSPLYYAHITQPPVNPRFIAVLPHAHEEPELSLVHLPATVRSPHSPNGFARVKKHVWLAYLDAHVRPGLGEGWNCEWILEGDGTKEGRQSLLDALGGNDSAKREWELVMEKSTATKIWLRSVDRPS